MNTENRRPNSNSRFGNRLGGFLKRLNVWDWMVGILVAIALFLAAGYTGHGLYILAKAKLAQVLLDQAWAQTVAQSEPQKPWPWLDSWPVAHIAIPRLDEHAVVLAGASGQALAFGPTHVNGTAQPGNTGVAVYAAHRDTHFSFMDKLVIGDVINVTNRDGVGFDYEIKGFRIARWDSSGLDPDGSGYNLALVTCWPLDAMTSGPLRYIAEAALVSPPGGVSEIAMK